METGLWDKFKQKSQSNLYHANILRLLFVKSKIVVCRLIGMHCRHKIIKECMPEMDTNISSRILNHVGYLGIHERFVFSIFYYFNSSE